MSATFDARYPKNAKRTYACRCLTPSLFEISLFRIFRRLALKIRILKERDVHQPHKTTRASTVLHAPCSSPLRSRKVRAFRTVATLKGTNLMSNPHSSLQSRPMGQRRIKASKHETTPPPPRSSNYFVPFREQRGGGVCGAVASSRGAGGYPRQLHLSHRLRHHARPRHAADQRTGIISMSSWSRLLSVWCAGGCQLFVTSVDEPDCAFAFSLDFSCTQRGHDSRHLKC